MENTDLSKVKPRKKKIIYRLQNSMPVRHNGVVLNNFAIARILPHAGGALMGISHVSSLDTENKTITVVKAVCSFDPLLIGHFPHNPVMPAHNLIEMANLTAALLFYCLEGDINGLPLFRGIDGVKSSKQVKPGDVIFISAKLTKLIKRGIPYASFSSKIYNQDNQKVMTIKIITGIVIK